MDYGRPDQLTRQIEALFETILPAGVSVSASRQGEDYVVLIGSKRLLVRPVSRGDRRNVRLALRVPPKPDVIVATELSDVARAEISEEGVNWADGTGAAEIAVTSIVISRSGRRPRARRRHSSWTTATIGIAEALVDGAKPTVEAVTQASGYSPATAVRALSALTELGLLESTSARGPRSGRRIVDKDSLLDEFAEEAWRARPHLELRCAVLWRHPFNELAVIGERWSEAGIDWAVTGALSASIQAPFDSRRTPTGVVYVDVAGELALLHTARVGGVEPMKGGRLVLQPFPTRATRKLSFEVEDLRLTSWPRTYADLRFDGVRGEDAAEHLREARYGR